MAANEPNMICQFCGSAYYRKPSRMKGSKYCSKVCFDKAQFKGEIKICATCGKEIKVSPSLVRENNFCSNECRLEWLSRHVTENMNIPGHSAGHKAPHLTALNQERNPKLALEADAVNRGTYNHYQHRKMMEEILGRKLKPDEDVHHINGKHDDNRPENLQVMKHSDYLKLHWQLARERGVI